MQPGPSESSTKTSVSEPSSRASSQHQHGQLRSRSSASHGVSRGRESVGSAAAVPERRASPRETGGESGDREVGEVKEAGNEDDENVGINDISEADEPAEKSPKAGKPNKAPAGASPIALMPNGMVCHASHMHVWDSTDGQQRSLHMHYLIYRPPTCPPPHWSPSASMPLSRHHTPGALHLHASFQVQLLS